VLCKNEIPLVTLLPEIIIIIKTTTATIMRSKTITQIIITTMIILILNCYKYIAISSIQGKVADGPQKH
jgi:hypothetical protein